MTKRNRKIVSRDQVSITRESDFIIGKAQERDFRVVWLGNLILFSTQTGDAWMLDPEDGLALCLARDGERQDYSVLETATNFQIGWNAHYQIEDDLFMVVTQDGRMHSILGYPTKEILRQKEHRTTGSSGRDTPRTDQWRSVKRG